MQQPQAEARTPMKLFGITDAECPWLTAYALLLLHAAVGMCAVLVGHYIVFGRQPEPLPTNRACIRWAMSHV
jgi:hypothetical protein